MHLPRSLQESLLLQLLEASTDSNASILPLTLQRLLMASNTDQASLEQEVRSLQAYANEYSQQFELLTQQLRFIESARGEALASIESLEAFRGLEGDVPTLLNLGGGVSVHATVTDTKNIMVGIGAGI